MALTLSGIDQALKAQVKAKKIVLNAALFNNEPTITQTLSVDFFNTDNAITILAVANYKYDTEKKEISFSGKAGTEGHFANMVFSDVSIKLDVSTPSKPVPQINIIATPPKDWTLDQSFPALDSEPVKTIGFSTSAVANEPISPQFFWANYNDKTNEVVEGYFFQGIMDLKAPYNFLDLFLGPDSVYWISGPIGLIGAKGKNITDYQPAAKLSADIYRKTISLGIIKLSNIGFALSMNPTYNPQAKAFQTHSALDLTANLIFMKAIIPIDFKITGADEPILFRANMEGAFAASLQDLSALVFGNTTQSLAVPGRTIAKPNGITLEDIGFSYTPSGPNKGLNSIFADIGTAPGQTWKIWDGVELENIAINFTVIPKKGSSGTTTFSGSFHGFINEWLRIDAAFTHKGSNNDFTFYGGLAKPVTVTELVTFFTGKTIKELPKLSVDILNVEVSKSTGKPVGFNGQFEMSGDWTIIKTAFDIKLRSLLFDIQHIPGDDGKSSNIVKAGGMIDIGAYQFSVEADYTTEKAWSFTGDMVFISNDTKSSTFGEELNSFFQMDTELPGFIADWYIKNIHVAFETKSGNFTFTCLLADDKYDGLELEFDFIITNDGKKHKMEFDGILTYTTEKFDLKFEVDLVIETNTVAPKKTTTFTVTYNAEKPVTLSEFLAAISKEIGVEANIPASLDLDADLKDLAFILIKEDEDPMRVEVAGKFELLIGSKPDIWNIYLTYSNDCYFESQGEKVRAINAKTTKPDFVFGLSFGGVLELQKLPLVGRIPGIGDFSIDKLGFYYTNAVFSATLKKLIFTIAELSPEGSSSADFATAEVHPMLNAADPAGESGEPAPGEKKPPLTADPGKAFVTQPKFSLLALFGNQKKKKDEKPKGMPLASDTGAQEAGKAFAKKQADPRKPIKWLEINKTIGPVDLMKIGLSYDKPPKVKPPKSNKGELGIVGLYLTGGFTVAGLSLVLDRLGITFPIPNPLNDVPINDPWGQVGFHLGGMFLEFKQPGLEIAGGFINLPGGSVNMIGEFIVEAGPYGLQGYGGYSDQLSAPSLFIFLRLTAPIGGPPFFFVNGVAGGFGVNRGFKLPTFEELATYPLLPANSNIPSSSGLAGKSQAEKLDAMEQSLLSLAKYFPVENGQYWFAIGLEVSSFDMLDVSAMLMIAFGVNLEIAVIGSAAMTLPVAEPEPIAFIQINFEVSYSSSCGLLAVMGVITPSSFLFKDVVRISGGFAFYTWFSGPHSGDFVLTIGGYNSHYKRPEYYPNVPRMELKAGIGIVNMIGQTYFALLPTMLMAGLDFKATANLGPIQAWFYAAVDFLIGWKPFHYEAGAAVQLGASFTINLGFVKIKISIHVGVALNIWGPKFGGKAKVDLSIISFTIHFGSKAAEAPLLSWDEFQEFLPGKDKDSDQDNAPKKKSAPLAMEMMADAVPAKPAKKAAAPTAKKALVDLVGKVGLKKEFPENAKIDNLNWIVDANHFEIKTHSTAPCTAVSFNGTPLPADYNYFAPGNLKEQINSPAHASQQAPYFIYEVPQGGTEWNKIPFGIPPMGRKDIQTTHVVNFSKVVGEEKTPCNDLIITLHTDGVPSALWGNNKVKKSAANSDKTVIKDALVQLILTPMLWFPSRTTFIPYYYLVFNTNNLFLTKSVAPKVNTTKVPNHTKVYDNMRDGATFQTTEPVRTKISEALKGLGFTHLELKNSDQLSTQDYVADPLLVYMGTAKTSLFKTKRKR